MLVVKKYKVDEKPQPLFNLTQEQKSWIYTVFFLGNSIPKNKEAEILALLSKIRNNESWIQCDCIDENPPLFTVKRIRLNGTLFLSRINSRGDHSPGCLFAREIPSSKKSTRKTPYKSNKIFHLHLRDSEIADKSTDGSRERSPGGGTILPRLARILFTLVENSGSNVLSLPLLDINSQYRLLHREAGNFFLEPDIKVSDYFWTHPAQVGYAGLELKRSMLPWPENSRRHGLFVVTADEIEEESNSIFCKVKGEIKKITFSGILKKLSGRMGQVSAPYLVIFTITDAVSDGFFQPMNVFVVPVHSKSLLVPVDSSYERKVLSKLLQALPYWKKCGAEVRIKKPLFDTVVHTQEGEKSIRPDFLISANGKKIILEVSGSHEVEYLERKKRTHALMAEFGTLINFDACEAEKNGNWQQALNFLLRDTTRLVVPIGGKHG